MSAATMLEPVARRSAAALRAIGAILVIVVFGAGVPLLWVWVGSLMQGGTAPSMSGLGVALGGIIATYAALAVAVAWLKERVRPTSGPVRHDWSRSLSAERLQRGRTTHPIEDVIVVATVIVGIVCTAWFFLFGSPGVPTAP